MPDKSIFQRFLDADKVIGLQTGDFTRAKKVLTPVMCDLAVTDGITLATMREEDDYHTETYAAFVVLERRSTKPQEMVKRLSIAIKKLNSDGCRALLKALEGAKATEFNPIQEEVQRYAKLVRSACADVELYQNVLINPHVKTSYDDGQRECARAMCRHLKITVKEVNG